MRKVYRVSVIGAVLGITIAWLSVGAVFGATAHELTQQLIHGDQAQRFAAREELRGMGISALEPLLRCLYFPDAGQRQLAMDTLHDVVMTRKSNPVDSTAMSAALLQILAQVQRPDVREFIVVLLADSPDANAIPTLAKLIRESRYAHAAAVALAKIPGPAATGVLLSAAGTAGAEQAHLVDILGRRGDLAAVPLITRLLTSSHSSAVRAAAATAIGDLGATASLPALNTAAGDRDAAVREHALQSIIALGYAEIAAGNPNGAINLFGAVLQRSHAESPTLAALEGIAKTGTARAAPILGRYLTSDDLRVQALAVNALSHFSSDSAAQMLGDALKRASSATAPLIIQALAATGRPSVVPIITESVENASSAALPQAVAAYLRLADSLASAGKRDQAVAMYQKMLDDFPLPDQLEHVAQQLESLNARARLPKLARFITHWWVIGPFPNPARSGLERVYFPEQEINLEKKYTADGKELAWQKAVAPQGVVNLLPFWEQNNNVVGYGYAEITVDRDMDAVLYLGSDDGIACWVNGQRVFLANVDRSLTMDNDRVPVTLKSGVNRILVKVSNGSGDWQYCVRVTDPKGKLVDFREREK